MKSLDDGSVNVPGVVATQAETQAARLFPRLSKLNNTQREAATGYMFVSIWVIGFIIFTLGPMLASLYFSFTDYDIVSSPVWVGLKNYINLFSDPLFWKSIQVTLYYAVLSLPLGLVVGFLLAVLLNQEVFGLKLWRTLYYVPSILAGVAVTLLWIRILSPNQGAVNAALALIGIKGPGWFNDPHWSVPALVIMSMWGVGGGMIIYLAGLQGIPTDLYDAAKVDGANAYQRFLHITIPMMTPVIFYNLVLGMIGTFQFFTAAYVAGLSNINASLGAPVYSTLFYNLYLYQSAFRYFDMGYASAMAWVLFLVILVITLLIFRSSSFWVYYEGQLGGRD
jgi:multiple sugar transport system permease protein